LTLQAETQWATLHEPHKERCRTPELLKPPSSLLVADFAFLRNFFEFFKSFQIKCFIYKTKKSKRNVLKPRSTIKEKKEQTKREETKKR